jgi:hypothetical protein
MGRRRCGHFGTAIEPPAMPATVAVVEEAGALTIPEDFCVMFGHG